MPFVSCIEDVNSTPAPTIVDDDSFEKELCKAKEAGEWFRLQAGDGDNCRDVIQCTSSVIFVFNPKPIWFSNKMFHFLFVWFYFEKRVCKPFVVQLVLLSTLRSKLATGRNKSRTAWRKRKSAKLSPSSPQMSLSVRSVTNFCYHFSMFEFASILFCLFLSVCVCILGGNVGLPRWYLHWTQSFL